MTAAEAKEIIKREDQFDRDNPPKINSSDSVHSGGYNKAKGFLEGMEADEVKAFVEALKPFAENFRICSVGELDTLILKAKAALANYLDAIKSGPVS